MDQKKVAMFMALAGQREVLTFEVGDEKTRLLGAQLLLSEVLEYVIKGLGVQPSVNGVAISDPNSLTYTQHTEPDQLEMLDGLADVGYTMFWNALAFGVPLEEGFSLVCDNNLEKFVALPDWTGERGALPESEWHCEQSIVWPEEVTSVTIVEVAGALFAVGKDIHGKVRKPSSFKPVQLKTLLPS